MLSRLSPILFLALFAASSAGAATLTVTPDKLVYSVGETITLTVLGEMEGTELDPDKNVFGRLEFDSALVVGTGSVQSTLLGFGGGIPWILAPIGCGAGFCDAFDQSHPVGDNLEDLIATVTLTALAPGLVGVLWNVDTGSGLELDFFDVSSAPGASFTIVPEPATGALLAAGLLALAAAPRR